MMFRVEALQPEQSGSRSGGAIGVSQDTEGVDMFQQRNMHSCNYNVAILAMSRIDLYGVQWS